jgi:hypothetical protein
MQEGRSNRMRIRWVSGLEGGREVAECLVGGQLGGHRDSPGTQQFHDDFEAAVKLSLEHEKSLDPVSNEPLDPFQRTRLPNT